MVELKNINGQPIVDYMARDYESLLAAMRSLIPFKMPEWRDFESEADFGNVLLQLFAHMGDILGYYQDRIANESFLTTAQTRRAVIEHLYLIGYQMATAAPASASLDLRVPVAFTGEVLITRGMAFATKGRDDAPSVRFEYTNETGLKIDFDASAIEIEDNKKIYRGVPVEEGRLIQDEILGVSDGTPNQRYTLLHKPLILRSRGSSQAFNRDIILMTDVGNNVFSWDLRPSLTFSRGDQRDYEIKIDEDDRAEILFGDGSFGHIPEAGSAIKATYRIGGGRHGNVGPESIQTIIDAPDLALAGAKVTNPKPASGGADRESIEHAVTHAPQAFRSRQRAVTRADYVALALDFPGVAKVRAEPTGWNTVTLFVAPAGGDDATDVLRANLIAYFEDKRPVSTVIEIANVTYTPIYVTARVGVEPQYDTEEVLAYAANAGARLLAFENVDFGKTLYLSKFFEAIEAVAGVAFVNITEFTSQDPQGSGNTTRSSNLSRVFTSGAQAVNLATASTIITAKTNLANLISPEFDLVIDPLQVDPASFNFSGLTTSRMAASGKIELGPNELPAPPDQPAYAGGIRIVLDGS